MPADPELAALRILTEIRPSPRRASYTSPSFCPLGCGFNLMMDWDNHFMPCFLSRVRQIWFEPARTP